MGYIFDRPDEPIHYEGVTMTNGNDNQGMTDEQRVMKPKWGDKIENLMASESNPHRIGFFVREYKRSGKLNHGTWWECTDGNGSFWSTPADGNRRVIPVAQPSAVMRNEVHSKACLDPVECISNERLEEMASGNLAYAARLHESMDMARELMARRSAQPSPDSGEGSELPPYGEISRELEREAKAREKDGGKGFGALMYCLLTKREEQLRAALSQGGGR